MKLSEAIRKGCEGTYQVFGIGFDGNKGYCAWGAAQQGVKSSHSNWREFLNMKGPEVCPSCAAIENDNNHPLTLMGFMVMHLNDEHHWSREAIADWVETVEATQLEEKFDKIYEMAGV